jgi:hypothetical protein
LSVSSVPCAAHGQAQRSAQRAQNDKLIMNSAEAILNLTSRLNYRPKMPLKRVKGVSAVPKGPKKAIFKIKPAVALVTTWEPSKKQHCLMVLTYQKVPRSDLAASLSVGALVLLMKTAPR